VAAELLDESARLALRDDWYQELTRDTQELTIDGLLTEDCRSSL
jgi:hypothetical protein